MFFAAFYGIVVGLLMMGWWTFSFAKGQVPELRTEPVRLYSHVAAEFLRALLLVVSGFGLLFGRTWALSVYFVAVGLLIYSMIVSPGYFAQRKEWSLVGMFAILLLLALLSLVFLP